MCSSGVFEKEKRNERSRALIYGYCVQFIEKISIDLEKILRSPRAESQKSTSAPSRLHKNALVSIIDYLVPPRWLCVRLERSAVAAAETCSPGFG